jgi:hypothetical protein
MDNTSIAGRIQSLREGVNLPKNRIVLTTAIEKLRRKNPQPTTNLLKKALDEKIKNEFENKTYDLIVHFKGFNNLFDYGVYNGELTENETHELMKQHIEKIANEYKDEINQNNLDNKIEGKTLLLVWDGDGLEATQWTRVMTETAKKLVYLGAILEFLCCYQKKDGIYGHKPDFTNSLNNLGKVHQYTYEDLGVKDYNEVGMVLLYVTSKVLKVKDNKQRLVLCAGGGDTPVNEYKFTQNDSTIVDDTKKYPLALQLINEMNPDNFKWMASKFIKSRKTINAKDESGVEESKMTEANGIEMINSNQYAVTLGGARKKRTIKKKKSLKKKSKKNKSKSKRKC